MNETLNIIHANNHFTHVFSDFFHYPYVNMDNYGSDGTNTWVTVTISIPTPLLITDDDNATEDSAEAADTGCDSCQLLTGPTPQYVDLWCQSVRWPVSSMTSGG